MVNFEKTTIDSPQNHHVAFDTSPFLQDQVEFIREALPKRGTDWARRHMENVATRQKLEGGLDAWPLEIRQLVEAYEPEPLQQET